MVGLYRDPEGEKVFNINDKGITWAEGNNGATELGSVESDQESAVKLRKRIRELEGELSSMVCFCCNKKKWCIF